MPRSPAMAKSDALRERADRLLVERGFFESRAKAQAAIEAGLVIADDRVVRKVSEEISVDASLRASAPHPYVSRGGVKLAAAIDHFGFDVVTAFASMSVPPPADSRMCYSIAVPGASMRSMSAAASSTTQYVRAQRLFRLKRPMSEICHLPDLANRLILSLSMSASFP